MFELTDTLAGLIERGGVVMIPLLILSVISLTLIIERAWFWISTNKRIRLQAIGRVTALLAAGKRDQVGAMLKGDKSPYARLVGRMLKYNASDATAISAVEDERPRLERFMVTLSTIITAAPLLGILGTVLGIIRSFQLLSDRTTLTDPTAVSTGIAEALLTTALGLVVALITLFPYMIYRGQLNRALGRLEALAAAGQEGERLLREKQSARETVQDTDTSPADRKSAAGASPRQSA